MWLSVLLESVRQTKLFKPQSKLSPAISLLKSFSLSFLFCFLHLLKMLTPTQNALSWYLSHQHHRPSPALSCICLRISFRRFSTALHSELTCQCLPPVTPKNLFSHFFLDISHCRSFIHTYGARKD